MYGISSGSAGVSGEELIKNRKPISLFEVVLGLVWFFLVIWRISNRILTFDTTFYRTYYMTVHLSQRFFSCRDLPFFLLNPLTEVTLIIKNSVVKIPVIHSYFLFWCFPLRNFKKITYHLLVFSVLKIISLLISLFFIFSKIKKNTELLL